MKRSMFVVLRFLLVAAAAVTVAAQASTAGWKERIDRSTNAEDPDPAGDVKFMAEGNGFHTANPQAAVFYNPSNTASGAYTLQATFSQNARSSHPNYLGLIFGGSGLDGANQAYTYFLVAPQNGTWLLKRRMGDQTSDVAPRAASDAVTQLDASGKASNTLRVRVGADSIEFAVNGTVVHTMPKAGVTTDGIYGFRVNHALPDVSITGLSLQ